VVNKLRVIYEWVMVISCQLAALQA